MTVPKLILTACAAALVLITGPVIAAEKITTALQDWQQLPEAWQVQLMKDLQSAGALDRGDYIEYTGTPQARVTETNGGLTRQAGQKNSGGAQSMYAALIGDFCQQFVKDKYRPRLIECRADKSRADACATEVLGNQKEREDKCRSKYKNDDER